jgi:hypothetical protein
MIISINQASIVQPNYIDHGLKYLIREKEILQDWSKRVFNYLNTN